MNLPVYCFAGFGKLNRTAQFTHSRDVTRRVHRNGTHFMAAGFVLIRYKTFVGVKMLSSIFKK
jgi:hypothetical protein